MLALVQTFFEDAFDTAVAGVVKGQGAVAGGFQALGAVAFGKSDDALRCPKVVQHAITKEGLDEVVAGRTDGLCLFETPLGIAHQESARLGRKMFVDGRACPGCVFTGVYSHHVVVLVDPHGGGAGPQPELLTHQSIRHGVSTLLELHVAVPVNLHLGPGRLLRWIVG